MKLFSGDGGGSDSDSDSGDLSKIEINEEFARRFEHNKKREDLQRFEELKKQGVISDEDNDSEDSSEDDEDDIGNYSLEDDLKFFDNLIKIRKNDPSLKNAKLSDSDNSDNDKDNDNDDANDTEEVNGEVKKRKRKPKYLKDVNAELALEKGAEFDDEDEEMEIRNKTRKKSYVEELEMTRKEFLDAVDGIGDDEGEIFKEKEDEVKDDKDEVKIELDNKLNEYFEVEDEDEDENEKFLKDFFKKRMWLEEEKDGSKKYDIDVVDEIDVSEDEEEIYKQEDYERGFNFRYQENRDDRVEGHSRKIVDSVRKVDNARKIQRKNKEERMAQAEFDRKEELKRLKNLKKKEMNEKIRKIREIAGFREKDVCVLDERDLKEDFDPEEYDRKMKKAFDDEFYEAEDVDPKFGSDDDDDGDGELKKPNFDEEDELLGLPKGWDGDENRDGFLAIREKTLKKKEKVFEEGEKKKKKRKTSELEEEVIKKELEEYYKLDYEDTIGDLKTRFKYRPVNKNTYGLKAKDILIVDDKELNQLIPLKKMATYREDEFIVPRNKIKEQKQKIKSLLKGESSDGSRHVSKKSKHEVAGDVETEKLKSETENEEPQSLSKSKKMSKREVGDVETEKPKSGTENDEAKSLSKSSKKSKLEVGDVETAKPKSETENEEQKPLSKKQRRKMRNKEFKLGPNRLMAYQKIESKGVKKKKNKA